MNLIERIQRPAKTWYERREFDSFDNRHQLLGVSHVGVNEATAQGWAGLRNNQHQIGLVFYNMSSVSGEYFIHVGLDQRVGARGEP